MFGGIESVVISLKYRAQPTQQFRSDLFKRNSSLGKQAEATLVAGLLQIKDGAPCNGMEPRCKQRDGLTSAVPNGQLRSISRLYRTSGTERHRTTPRYPRAVSVFSR